MEPEEAVNKSSTPPPLFATEDGWETLPTQEGGGNLSNFKIHIGHKGLSEDEVGFQVKFKEHKKKKKFVLALGHHGVRLLENTTEEEVGRWNYKDVKNISYNTNFHYFQFSTCMDQVNTQTYTFKTRKCAEMFDQVKHLLTQNLQSHSVGDANSLIEKATHHIARDAPKKTGMKNRVVDGNENYHTKLTELLNDSNHSSPVITDSPNTPNNLGAPRSRIRSKSISHPENSSTDFLIDIPEAKMNNNNNNNLGIIPEIQTKSTLGVNPGSGKKKRVKSAMRQQQKNDDIGPIVQLEDI